MAVFLHYPRMDLRYAARYAALQKQRDVGYAGLEERRAGIFSGRQKKMQSWLLFIRTMELFAEPCAAEHITR